MDQQSRLRGALVGLAVGDAVGTTLEFNPPGSFEPITDMVGRGPLGLKPGQWTDDTSMALCLAASLVESCGFDERDQMQRYMRWWREGYVASNGRCFDIGNTTAGALRRFENTGDPFSGSTSPHSAANGSIMRLAPVPLFFAADPALWRKLPHHPRCGECLPEALLFDMARARRRALGGEAPVGFNGALAAAKGWYR